MADMTRSNEKGVALVFTLFLMASLSALAVSLMFLSQTETSSTRNYRTMSQARYAGEAGVHKAINFLLAPANEAAIVPAAAALGNYNMSVSPITCLSGCTTTGPVVLSGVSGASNFPNSTIATAFEAAAHGSLPVNFGSVNASVNYVATATLISMRQLVIYGGVTGVVQTWEITATGTVPGAMPATVEVTAMLERNFVAADTYAIFATGSVCGAIDLGGTIHTDSYNSTAALVSGAPVIDSTGGGSVGTNGNLTIGGNVTVNGNLDTPRTGVGDCTAGTPTALSPGGHADVNGSVVRLPQAKIYPTPAAPTPTPPTTTVSIGTVGGCALILAANPLNPPTCSVSGNTMTVLTNGSNPVLLGNVTLASNLNLNIQYGSGGSPATGTAVVNANSFKVGSNATMTVGANTSVTMNIAGTSLPTGTEPLDFHAGGFANTSFDPSKLQIIYAGTGTIEMIGGPNASATVYAPNAAVVMQGNADFYGSILSSTYNAQGDASVHYDKALSNKIFILGNYVLTSFSWKKY